MSKRRKQVYVCNNKCCFFWKEDWRFSCRCFLWKPGTRWPRQHNQSSSWLRGEGERDVAFFIWSLSALVRHFDVKEWVSPPPPSLGSPPYLSLSLSYSRVRVPHPNSLSPCTFCWSLQVGAHTKPFIVNGQHIESIHQISCYSALAALPRIALISH